MNLENNLVSKLDGKKRNESLLSEYDKEAREQIEKDLQKQLEDFPGYEADIF